ncbi:hypothetical protein CDAR_528831 [Caerostris darwini]|uniref:Uncharacterized protein n=1 Tax=Caerostris darwini TaxID=1538125 RepID=A0AAV4UNT1_9ARAC|nr:hypothetical protein CDAR_528831 [Caerostris darwini]
MANRKAKMADGRKTIALVTDQETGGQGVVRDHHPLPVSGRHVNPGASPVPCGQCFSLKLSFYTYFITLKIPLFYQMEKQCHYQQGIEIKLSILPLQGQAFSTPEELAKTVLSALNPALLGHNPSVSPLSGLPHIRFDPPLPRSLISIRQGGTSSWLK